MTNHTTPTAAQTHVEQFQDNIDGQDFTWCDDPLAAQALPLQVERASDRKDTYRYEWPDGSSIVVAGACWDFGVHSSRLIEAQAVLDTDAGAQDIPGAQDARFAMPAAGYGLDETWQREMAS